MKIYLIQPVRRLEADQKLVIESYVHNLEGDGHEVHCPHRDTKQDNTELGILRENMEAMDSADEIHIAWDTESLGSHFDVGVTMFADKPIKLMPGFPIKKTEDKSVGNGILQLIEEQNNGDSDG